MTDTEKIDALTDLICDLIDTLHMEDKKDESDDLHSKMIAILHSQEQS